MKGSVMKIDGFTDIVVSTELLYTRGNTPAQPENNERVAEMIQPTAPTAPTWEAVRSSSGGIGNTNDVIDVVDHLSKEIEGR